MIDRKTSFGVGYDLVTLDELKAIANKAVEKQRKTIIGYTNLNGAYLRRVHPAMDWFFKAADIVYCDGTPQHVWRRVLWGDVREAHRFTLTHNLLDVLSFFDDLKYKVYFLGSDTETLEKGLSHLRSRFPNLSVGGHHGYFDKSIGSSGNTQVLMDISRFKPDIIILGMGMPIQEKWIQENKDQIDVPVIWAAGAAIEYYSGKYPIRPKWIYNLGMEWMYRLLNDPVKLWHRYLVSPLFLIPELLNDLRIRWAHGRGEEGR